MLRDADPHRGAPSLTPVDGAAAEGGPAPRLKSAAEAGSAPHPAW